MTKYQCSTEYCCGQFHEWPEIVPCPKCGQTEPVRVWEAWGHPSGDLYCEDCTGFNSTEPLADYFTWHMEEGQPVIDKWEKQEPVVGVGGLISEAWHSHS